MKTIVIWNQFDYGVQYFVLDGDYSRFEGVFIGSTENQELQEELIKLLYTEDGVETGKIEFLKKFPTDLFYKERLGTVIVIECGYLP